MTDHHDLGNKIIDYWDDRSIGIDKATRVSLDGENLKIEDLIDGLNLRQGLKVADMGTGCGLIAVLLAKRGFRVTGIDMVGSMLERARVIAAEKNLEIEYIQRDI